MSRTADRLYVPYRMAALPYTPYRMIDVAVAAAQNKFTVISAFAGGGGSCTGYALAGGKLLRAIEFVEEAARTYRANFPECVIDKRDIRKISASDQTVAAFLASAARPRVASSARLVVVSEIKIGCAHIRTSSRTISRPCVLIWST
jgi:C-5 cytosine-specific DNA methylase